MIRKVAKYITVCLMMMVTVSAFGESKGRRDSAIVLGGKIMPKDTTKQRRFTNRLIAPKGEWQCGLSVMYTDMNSSNNDYMLVLQGTNANASMLTLSPAALYTFKHNHAVGVRFKYTRLSGAIDSATADLLGNMSLAIPEVNALSTTMGGSVFERTYIGIDKKGRFGIFWDYVLGYSRTRTQFKTSGSDSFSIKEKINIAFAPGIVYFPMNNISIQANISIADVSYSVTKAYQSGEVVGMHRDWKAHASLNLLNLSFGLTIHL